MARDFEIFRPGGIRHGMNIIPAIVPQKLIPPRVRPSPPPNKRGKIKSPSDACSASGAKLNSTYRWHWRTRIISILNHSLLFPLPRLSPNTRSSLPSKRYVILRFIIISLSLSLNRIAPYHPLLPPSNNNPRGGMIFNRTEVIQSYNYAGEIRRMIEARISLIDYRGWIVRCWLVANWFRILGDHPCC